MTNSSQVERCTIFTLPEQSDTPKLTHDQLVRFYTFVHRSVRQSHETIEENSDITIGSMERSFGIDFDVLHEMLFEAGWTRHLQELNNGMMLKRATGIIRNYMSEMPGFRTAHIFKKNFVKDLLDGELRDFMLKFINEYETLITNNIAKNERDKRE